MNTIQTHWNMIKKRNGKIVTIYKRDLNITANMVVFKELKQNYNSYDDKIIFKIGRASCRERVS